MNNGLFQVTDRIYQIRGFDISNMTIIEGNRGIIVIDPLISTEVARAGLELYWQHRGSKPVTAESTATAMSTISAACAASSTRPRSRPATSPSSPPTASWRR